MPCPACGVAVPMGYPRCPKCQTVMPALRSKRPTFREENLAGGTSVAPPDAGGSRAGWVLAFALLALGAGLAIYFATRSSPKREETPAVEPSSSQNGAAEPVEEEAAEEEEEARPRQRVDDTAERDAA